MKRLLLSLVLVTLSLGPSVGLAGAQATGPSAHAYLVGSAAPLTAAQQSDLKRAGATVKYAYRNFGGAAVSIPDSKLADVKSLPFVTSLAEDSLKQLTSVTSGQVVTGTTDLPGTPYWLDMMNAESNTTYDGTGVWVAVLDSGFYPNWRDYFDESSILTDKASAFISVMGTANDNQWDVGSDPHGMATAATIVGYRLVDQLKEGGWGTGFLTGAAGTYWVPGVASGAKVIPIKVCEPRGCYTSAINAGIDYVTELQKANPGQPIVINESLGGPLLDDTERAAIDKAIAAGVVVVASAGNEGDAGMGYPAAYAPVISVGAGGWRSQWSNYQDTPNKDWWLKDVYDPARAGDIFIAGFSSRQLPGQELDVVGPGRYIPLPYPCAQLYGGSGASLDSRTCAAKATPDSARAAPFQYMFMSGTSFSSPAVAGVVALIQQQHLGKTPLTQANVETLLKGSALPIGPGFATVVKGSGTPVTETWGTDATGSGWVLIDRALAAAAPSAKPSPPNKKR